MEFCTINYRTNKLNDHKPRIIEKGCINAIIVESLKLLCCNNCQFQFWQVLKMDLVLQVVSS